MARVLVVDDEKSIRVTLCEFLREDGHEPHSAENAAVAVALLDQFNFDVVIADIILPKVNGVELLKAIRKKTSYAQVIMMTGEPTVDTATEALRAGAFDYLYKPISKEDILKTVRNAVHVKILEEQTRRHQDELELLVTIRTRELAESERKYRSLVQASPDAIVVMSMEAKIIMANEQALAMFGYDSEKDLLQLKGLDFLPPKYHDNAVATMRRIMETNTVRTEELEFLRKDGTMFPAEIRTSMIVGLDGEPQGFILVIRDISKRRKAEKERALLASAIENAEEMVLIRDINGVIEYANPSFERITGYTRKEAAGNTFQIIATNLYDDLFFIQIWNKLSAGDAWKGRIINRRKDSSSIECDAAIYPVKDKTGEITHFVAVERDMTHELKIESQLRQAQKMEAIGTLAGGIAHDFNNILSAVIGFTELVLADTAKGTIQHDNLLEVRKAGLRARDLVKQILTFSRQTEHEVMPVEANVIIKEVLKLLRSSLPKTIKIQEDIRIRAHIKADPTQVHQVIMNLCTNAYHAMRENGGTLFVGLEDVNFQDIDPDLELSPGSYVRLTVKDTGCGMDRGVLDRIFDPYFTTKKQGEGTGLGLAVVHGIVKSLRGGIKVESEPGNGSTFFIFFRKIEGTALWPPEKAFESLPSGTETILFIDDEPSIVSMGKQILSNLGYTVVTVTGSRAALELFQANPNKFHLVVTDMTMPDLTGDVLAREILKIRPQVPVVLCTGYSERITEEKALALGIRRLVMKPFDRADFAKIVRNVLDGK